MFLKVQSHLRYSCLVRPAFGRLCSPSKATTWSHFRPGFLLFPVFLQTGSEDKMLCKDPVTLPNALESENRPRTRPPLLGRPQYATSARDQTTDGLSGSNGAPSLRTRSPAHAALHGELGGRPSDPGSGLPGEQSAGVEGQTQAARPARRSPGWAAGAPAKGVLTSPSPSGPRTSTRGPARRAPAKSCLRSLPEALPPVPGCPPPPRNTPTASPARAGPGIPKPGAGRPRPRARPLPATARRGVPGLSGCARHEHARAYSAPDEPCRGPGPPRTPAATASAPPL